MNNETGSRIAGRSSDERTSGERDEKSGAGTIDSENEYAGSLNRDPITGTPGSHPLGTAVGTTSGAVAGAFAGAIAGPAGVVVGGVIGAIVGATVGHGSGEELNPTPDDDLEAGEEDRKDA